MRDKRKHFLRLFLSNLFIEFILCMKGISCVAVLIVRNLIWLLKELAVFENKVLRLVIGHKICRK